MFGYKCSRVHIHWKFCRSKALGSGMTFITSTLAVAYQGLRRTRLLGEVMATKEGTGSSSSNDGAEQSTGAKLYLA